ncbi:MAG: rRNA maturation RNase YbeY [Burkholderiaceae bacterium]
MPALELTIQGRARFNGLSARSTIARWIGAALERDAQLTLRFVRSREGRRLNADFRGKDYAADVLTFAYSTRPRVHADIVICVPVARRDARALNKSLQDHLAHLIVHATLHAHGYGHGNAVQANRMARREIRIMKGLGKRDPYQ